MARPLFAPQRDAQEGADEDALLAGINTTPLVDVMLVLLIIFLITLPVLISTARLSLPQHRAQPAQGRPDSIVLSVDRQGRVFWLDERITDLDSLSERLRGAAARSPTLTVQIRGDRQAHFDGVGQVLLACQGAGIRSVSFITEAPASQ